jgi:hypothetical protein
VKMETGIRVLHPGVRQGREGGAITRIAGQN